MASIGAYLRQAREQLGYTLEEMNRFTNIHIEYLHALENDQFNLLPSPFYAKAFLRTYAKSLGINPQPLLDHLDQVMRAQNPASQVEPPPSVEPAPRKQAMQFGRNSSEGRGFSSSNRSASMSPYSSPADEAAMNTHRYPALPSGADEAAMNTRRYLALPSGGSEGANDMVAAKPAKQLPSMSSAQVQSPFAAGSVPRQVPPLSPTNKMQNTGRFQSAQASLAPAGSAPLVPRKVALQKQVGSDDLEKRGGLSKWMIAVAVGALLLLGAGVYAFTHKGGPAAVQKPKTQQDIPDANANASAKGVTTPVLEQGETADNDYAGDLYYISNVNKLEVTLKAKDGESRVLYAPTPNDQPTVFTLKVGDETQLDTKGQDHIWFRLSYPSNVEISVNGQIIPTDAQDTEKSYRIQLKK
jgi:transcriptional regulator with XRE-family HTH domain